MLPGGGEFPTVPVLELRALPDQHHPSPRQVALVPELPGRNPNRGQRARARQPVQPPGVERVRFVDLPHHELRLAGMHELGHTARRLDLVDDPVPVADRLHRDRGPALTPLEKLLERPALMWDPLLPDEPAIRPGHRGQRVPLVRIERDILHVLRLLPRLTPSSVLQRPRYPHRVREAQRFHPINGIRTRDSVVRAVTRSVVALTHSAVATLRSSGRHVPGRSAQLPGPMAPDHASLTRGPDQLLSRLVTTSGHSSDARPP